MYVSLAGNETMRIFPIAILSITLTVPVCHSRPPLITGPSCRPMPKPLLRSKCGGRRLPGSTDDLRCEPVLLQPEPGIRAQSAEARDCAALAAPLGRRARANDRTRRKDAIGQ